MRLAVLSDIHGNLAALEAVLGHAEQERVDGYVVIGDVVIGAPDSVLCWERVTELQCPVARGNHEGYLAEFGTEEAPAAFLTPQFAPVAWTARRFDDETRRLLGDLPVSVKLPEIPDVRFVHASLRNDRDSVDAYTPETELAAMFSNLTERYVFRGHNHLAATRLWQQHIIHTVASVGVPLNSETKAQYALLEPRAGNWHPTFHAVPYDVEATLKRFHDTGYLEEAGPMAHLFYREVATATHQFNPFWRRYERYSESGRLGLEAAVRNFCSFGSP